MKGIQTIQRWLVPDPTLAMEHQFYRVLCLLGGLLCLLVILPLNAFQEMSPLVSGFTAAFGLLALALALASLKGIYYKKTLLLAFVVTLDLLWFPNGGSQGSVGLFFTIAALCLVLFLEGPWLHLSLALLSGNAIALLLVERAWPERVRPFTAPIDRLLDLGSGHLISLFLAALILWVILDGYKRRTREFKESLQALAASEAMYRDLLQRQGQGFGMTDADERFVIANPVADEIFGVAPGELAGRSLLEFLPVDQRDLLGAQSAQRTQGQSGTYELEIQRPDGERRTLLVTVTPRPVAGGQAIGVFRDITESKRAEAMLQEAQALTAAIFDSTSDFIWSVAAADFRILTFNQALHQHFLSEYGVRLRIGMPLQEAYASVAAQDQWRGYYARTLEQGAFTVDHVTLSASHRLLLTFNLLERHGQVFAISVFGKDITDRVQHEEERARLMTQMNQTARLESLGSLAGGVAHDMNNVLGAILGLASVHQREPEAAAALRKDMDTITRACQRGGALVKGLLGFAREGLAEERELDLNTVVREEVALLERTTFQKIRLHLDLAEDLGALRGDPGALSHCLMNLCVNAVDAMPGGGTLTLRTRNEGAASILLEVADTGCGMAREVLDKAMEPFFTTKPQGQGTGLGLPIVFGTVKAHQGQVSITSEPGQGTRVFLRFPACARSSPAPNPPAAERPTASRSLAVLLVDDDDLVLASVEAILETLGHVARAVSGGESALAELAGGYRPDVVILDLNMPGLDGAGTLPRLRRLNGTVPVLLATGRIDQNALDLAKGHPGVVLLAKPFSLGDLQKSLVAVT